MLSDVIVHRCELKDILNVFDEDRDNFEEILNNNLDDVSCIEDEMNAIENCVILRISLPHRKFIVDNGIKKDFRGYKDTFYPIEVIVKPNEYSDYSRYFMDFYDYEEKAVDEAYKVLTSDNYPCDLKDMQTFEKTLIKNIESREELGLK